MSDNPRNAQRAMERVFLCNDIWFDCFPWLSRANVGLAFALVSDRFDGLSDRYLNSKKRPWTLGNLWITRKQDDAMIVKNYDNCNTVKLLPLPVDPLPDNVIGFRRITIRYIDQKVIDFLCRICRLFQQPTKNDGIGLELRILSSQVRSLDIVFDSIWPLINPSAITKLYFSYSDSFDVFFRRISPTFLLDLANNVRVVDVQFCLRLEHAGNGQLLWEWLHTPRADGQPKVLMNYFVMHSNTMELLKMEFLSAETAAVSFVIAMKYTERAKPFVLDNLRTGERLTFRLVDEHGNGATRWLLERGPIGGGGRNVEQWAKWGREAMGTEPRHNLLDFWFGDYAIGPLSENSSSRRVD